VGIISEKEKALIDVKQGIAFLQKAWKIYNTRGRTAPGEGYREIKINITSAITWLNEAKIRISVLRHRISPTLDIVKRFNITRGERKVSSIDLESYEAAEELALAERDLTAVITWLKEWLQKGSQWNRLGELEKFRNKIVVLEIKVKKRLESVS